MQEPLQFRIFICFLLIQINWNIAWRIEQTFFYTGHEHNKLDINIVGISITRFDEGEPKSNAISKYIAAIQKLVADHQWLAVAVQKDAQNTCSLKWASTISDKKNKNFRYFLKRSDHLLFKKLLYSFVFQFIKSNWFLKNNTYGISEQNVYRSTESNTYISFYKPVLKRTFQKKNAAKTHRSFFFSSLPYVSISQ